MSNESGMRTGLVEPNKINSRIVKRNKHPKHHTSEDQYNRGLTLFPNSDSECESSISTNRRVSPVGNTDPTEAGEGFTGELRASYSSSSMSDVENELEGICIRDHSRAHCALSRQRYVIILYNVSYSGTVYCHVIIYMYT